MTTPAAALAARLPVRWVGAAARALYPRLEPELARLADYCPAGGTAVDVGSWYGPWARRLADRCDRVVAVEPVAHLAGYLRTSLPGNVRVVHGAACDREGTARLWLPEGDQGDRGLSSLTRSGVHAHSVEVPALTVDALGLGDVVFVKMDVDGGELPALRGAEGTLARQRPALLIELEARIQEPAPVVGLLAGLGYQGWVLPDRAWVALADFDLAAHQERTEHLVHRGMLRRTLSPGGARSGTAARRERYVNSVLFLPEGRDPGYARAAPYGA
ncbi:FkbM family methyltransferase [Streptomyces zhihengii]|uniref:FkbM family methyltransferase n=1 Tax=Streptomyces zhihengii TaxID=1818004 RepID=A0ABS2V0Z9_9ACTN|nr:FkbM family methyltransferase [Streptomyces zhihengii]MBM9623363.1 FkbM family methyltransferase [Streptomyces zhihengii]